MPTSFTTTKLEMPGSDAHAVPPPTKGHRRTNDCGILTVLPRSMSWIYRSCRYRSAPLIYLAVGLGKRPPKYVALAVTLAIHNRCTEHTDGMPSFSQNRRLGWIRRHLVISEPVGVREEQVQLVQRLGLRPLGQPVLVVVAVLADLRRRGVQLQVGSRRPGPGSRSISRTMLILCTMVRQRSRSPRARPVTRLICSNRCN